MGLMYYPQKFWCTFLQDLPRRNNLFLILLTLGSVTSICQLNMMGNDEWHFRVNVVKASLGSTIRQDSLREMEAAPSTRGLESWAYGAELPWASLRVRKQPFLLPATEMWGDLWLQHRCLKAYWSRSAQKTKAWTVLNFKFDDVRHS